MTTRFNDAVNTLIALYKAAPALEGITVDDGVQVQTFSEPIFVVVGHDGTLEADGTLQPDALAGVFNQGNLEMPGVRSENGTVNCLIVCQSGDSGDTSGRRQKASDLLAALEDAVAAGGGYPAAAPGLMFDGTSDGRFINRQAMGGGAVMLAYRVSYSTGWD